MSSRIRLGSIRTFASFSAIRLGYDLCIELISEVVVRGFSKFLMGCRWDFMCAMEQNGKLESRDGDDRKQN